MDWAGDRIKRSADHALALRDMGLSASDGDHYAALTERLRKAEDVRIDIADAVDALREQIVAMAAHVSAARKHAEAIGGQKAIARRQREKAIVAAKLASYARQQLASYARQQREKEIDKRGQRAKGIGMEIPDVPSGFKVMDPSRQVCAVIAAGKKGNSARIHVDGIDFADYQKHGSPILLRHERDKVVAWCVEIKRSGGELIAVAQSRLVAFRRCLIKRSRRSSAASFALPALASPAAGVRKRPARS